MTGSIAVEVTGLTKDFGSFRAVDDLTSGLVPFLNVTIAAIVYGLFGIISCVGRGDHSVVGVDDVDEIEPMTNIVFVV